MIFGKSLNKRAFLQRKSKKLILVQASPGNERLNDLIQTVIRKVEERFTEEKENLNAVMMNDLTRQIDLIREKYGAEAFKRYQRRLSYLFVDEFQDSDDVQIRLIATIQEAFQLNDFCRR